jgi:hypothetical protein
MDSTGPKATGVYHQVARTFVVCSWPTLPLADAASVGTDAGSIRHGLGLLT